jgi:serine/threonine protein kinase
MNQADRLAPGTTLGAYEIISFIAAGGMGSVYRARNRILGDLRAVKVILPSLSSNPEFVQRFVREAQLAARIQHPNVVKMLEPAMDGQTMFLPMELLEGESLQDLARREAPLHPTVAIDLMIPVCMGLHAIHDAGIIHRDIKPANVFLSKDAQGNVAPKLIDLGAARDIDAGEQTSTGAVIGSAHYMPIEQAAGRKDIDLRVDVYALGVMLYLLLTRKRPYENDESGVAMAKVLQGASFVMPRELAPWIPVELEQLVLSAMAREREQRPSSAAEVAERLAAVRPLCEAIVMPPQIRERHVTGSASISKVTGPLSVSAMGNVNAIKSRGLPTPEVSQASVVHGVATEIPQPAKSKAIPLLVGVGVLALVLGGVGVAFALKGNASASNTAATRGSGVASEQPVVDSGVAVTAVGEGLVEDASVAAVAEDAAAIAQTAVVVEDSGVAAAPRAVRNAPPRNGGAATRQNNRGGCVPRPGVPCL